MMRSVHSLVISLYLILYCVRGAPDIQRTATEAEAAEEMSETSTTTLKTRCRGNDLVLLETASKESVSSVYVYRGWHTLASDTVAASGLYEGRLEVPDKGSVTLKDFQPKDVGLYTMEVTQEDDTKLLYHTMLYLDESPVTEDGQVHMDQVPSPGNQGTLRLTCGRFTSLGFPPAAVYWQDPEDRVLVSTGQADGVFHLDLTPASPAGNYSCFLDCTSPLHCCLPPHSPLLQRAHTHVTSGVTSVVQSALTDAGEKMAVGMAALVKELLQETIDANKKQAENFETESRKFQEWTGGLNQQAAKNLADLHHKFGELSRNLSNENQQDLDDWKTQTEETAAENLDKLQQRLENRLKGAVSDLAKELKDQQQQDIAVVIRDGEDWKTQADAKTAQKFDMFETEIRRLIGNITELGKTLKDQNQKNFESKIEEGLAVCAARVESRVSERFASLQLKVDGLQQQTDVTKETKAVFLAKAQNERYENIPGNTPVMFGRVVHNIGNGYDPSTGVFTAPYTGTYIFTFQLFPGRRDVNVMADLLKNEEVVLRNRVGNIGGWSAETLTAATIQRASAGDRFWIRVVEGAGTFWGDYHTFFSGTLVSPDL